MKRQNIFYFIISSLGIGAAFGVALDNMAVGIAIGAAYGIGILPTMSKQRQENCSSQEKK